jgi:hypothetical protein
MDENSETLKDCLKEKCQSNEYILRQGMYIYISITYIIRYQGEMIIR